MFPEGSVPDWIRNHPAVEKSRGKKVFPKYGLANFRIPSELGVEDLAMTWDNSSVIRSCLRRCENYLVFELKPVVEEALKNAIGDAAMKVELESDPGKKEELKKQLISIEHLKGNLYVCLNLLTKNLDRNCLAIQPDGRARFLIRIPVVGSVGTKPLQIAKVGDTVQRAWGKLKLVIDDVLSQVGSPARMTEFDALPAVKKFNSNNNPVSLNNEIVFSGSGDAAAMDIATMSMRGLTSCQSWDDGEQDSMNACLIGSIASRYVGVIYLTNGRDYMKRGPKMIKRCVVRFGIDTSLPKKERIGVVILDRMYDSHNPAVAKAFMQALQSRTALKVIDFSDGTGEGAIPAGSFSVPEEKFENVYYAGDKYDHSQPWGRNPYKDVDVKDLNKKRQKELDGTAPEDPEKAGELRHMRASRLLSEIRHSIANFWPAYEIQNEMDLTGTSLDEDKLYRDFHTRIRVIDEKLSRMPPLLDKDHEFILKYSLMKYLKGPLFFSKWRFNETEKEAKIKSDIEKLIMDKIKGKLEGHTAI